MTFRPDITIDFTRSPRLIRIPNTSDEVTQQDLLDTLRIVESKIENASHSSLISSSGKEGLGGGTLVGITNKLLDSVLFFAPNTTVIESGTITTGDTNGVLLKDSAATFIANGVLAGATIINFTDQSLTSVISVDSEIQLTCEPLGGGTDNQFDSSDVYKIWNTIQKNIDGGNLVAVDDVGSEINPVLPTATTQVKSTAASSATLQEQADIQFASFGGIITIDVVAGTTGTDFPAGTPRQPCKNLADALVISTFRGIDRFMIVGNITFASGDDVAGKEIMGQSIGATTLTFDVGSLTLGVELENCTVQGTIVAPRSLTECQILNLTGAGGGGTGTIVARSCGLNGTLIISPMAEGEFHLLNCFSAVAGETKPIIDCNGADVDILIRSWDGGLEIRNFDRVGGNVMSLDYDSGDIVIADSCTTGTILLRGTGIWNNEDTFTGATVVTNNFVGNSSIANQVWDEDTADHTTAGSFGRRIAQIIAKINAVIGLS